MYNKVKSLESSGLSQRKIAQKLSINRRTVKKFIEMDISEATTYFDRGVQRKSGFDIAREFILEKLDEFPDIRSSNLYDQVLSMYPDIKLSQRAFRGYIFKLRQVEGIRKVKSVERKFKPVTNWQAGKYMQVDGGEKTVMLSNGGRMKLYFLSFVLCYSRAIYIHYSTKAYNTDMFIDAHLSAFSYFEGVPDVGVYDQTKLVAIKEEYREVVYNERFQKFFLKLGFRADVCEGYDPQSKGMVENTIGYIKNSFLYGRKFTGIDDVRRQSDEWLIRTANDRIHSITQRKPSEMLLEERKHLKKSVIELYDSSIRKADKTGFISYSGRFYSVPLRFQQKSVLIRHYDNVLNVYDPSTKELVCSWDTDKYHNRVNTNHKHYLDYKTSIEEEERLTIAALKEACIPNPEVLLSRIQADNNKHQRVQLQGLRQIVKKYPVSIWEDAIESILSLPLVTCSKISALLNVKKAAIDTANVIRSVQISDRPAPDKSNYRDISYYNRLLGVPNDK